jgi:uncharacterized small protein (DUF1192 family)
VKPWHKTEWCIPEVSAEFVACMEEVLDVYQEAYDAQRPVVCFDETSKQLIAETRPALPAQPGQVERYDTEYQRNGTRNLFLFFEPAVGYRHLEVTAQRTIPDFAECMRLLVEELYPHADCIRVVLDNLNTHRPASLYATFPPEQANRLLKHLEFHYTPKHGSWLNMAEIEFSVFSRQCLDRRIPDEATLKTEIAALEAERNAASATVNWRFTSPDARLKLNRLYPVISS